MGSCRDLSLDILCGKFKKGSFDFLTPSKNIQQESQSEDITPIKNPLPLKRRSLIADMNCCAGTTVEAAKHPMQMRTRKSRRQKEYCKPEEYVDYADDLSFLFDDFTDSSCRPRRKARRKRTHLLMREEGTDSFSERPEFNRFNTSELSSRLHDIPDDSNTIRKHKITSILTQFHPKRQRVDDKSMNLSNIHVLSQNDRSKTIQDFESRLFSSKVGLTAISKDTVTQMTLRRRHSTPILHVEPFSKKQLKRNDSNREEDSCVDIEFVDSPDSGFSSETSSSGTPDPECIRHFEEKLSLSRSSSRDSENNVGEKSEGLRLNLDGAAILEKERLERERKNKQEEQRLREKYRCRWVDCPNPFENVNSASLHSHLEKFHADNFSCMWEGCKVFGKASRKTTFLQRHISEHSGEKPYKCILDGCDASFSSTRGRQRHVEAHYSEVTYPKARVGNDGGSFPRYLLNSRRVKDKRRTLANRLDCMDRGTMSRVRNALIQNELAMETNEGEGVSEALLVTFRAQVRHNEFPRGFEMKKNVVQVIGQRSDCKGRRQLLVKWKPENLLANEWVMESEFVESKTLKRNELQDGAREALNSLIFFGKKSRGRKPSILDSLS